MTQLHVAGCVASVSAQRQGPARTRHFVFRHRCRSYSTQLLMTATCFAAFAGDERHLERLGTLTGGSRCRAARRHESAASSASRRGPPPASGTPSKFSEKRFHPTCSPEGEPAVTDVDSTSGASLVAGLIRTHSQQHKVSSTSGAWSHCSGASIDRVLCSTLSRAPVWFCRSTRRRAGGTDAVANESVPWNASKWGLRGFRNANTKSSPANCPSVDDDDDGTPRHNGGGGWAGGEAN